MWWSTFSWGFVGRFSPGSLRYYNPSDSGGYLQLASWSERWHLKKKKKESRSRSLFHHILKQMNKKLRSHLVCKPVLGYPWLLSHARTHTRTHLWWRQSTSAPWTVWQHPSDVLGAAQTLRRGSVFAPVAPVVHLPGGVGDLWPHEHTPLLRFALRNPAGGGQKMAQSVHTDTDMSNYEWVIFAQFVKVFHLQGFDLRAVLFLFLHALGTKTWLVQQSFKQVLQGWVPLCIIAVYIKQEVMKIVITRCVRQVLWLRCCGNDAAWWNESDWYLSSVVLAFTMGPGLPEEGELFSIHPRLQLQCRILPKRGHNEAEEQSDQHKHSRQDNLKAQTSVKQGKFLESEKY